MEKLLTDFRNSLQDRLLGIAWKQWAAMGVYSSVSPETGKLIDPEALICATMFLGRFEPRLFDECMDWLASNDRWVGMDRLKAIVEVYPEKCRGTLGAVLEYLNHTRKKHKYAAAADKWRDRPMQKPAPLFRAPSSFDNSARRHHDPVFKEWGLLRDSPTLREMSSPPDPDNPANLIFKLRGLFGVSARAEVIAVLLLKGEANSHQISRLAFLAQRNVHTILNDLTFSDLAYRVDAGRESIFSLDRTKWLSLLSLKGELKYLPWTSLFVAFISLVDVMWNEEETYRDPYLASSRFRDLLPEVAKAFLAAGLKTRKPDPLKYPGEAFLPAFIAYVMDALDEIEK